MRPERQPVTHLQEQSRAALFMQRHARSINSLACALLTALAGVAWAPDAFSAPKTVCTITVNSADEKDAFRRHLPADKFQFVELVERGRPDWLASACSTGVRCDALVISGHYDGGHEFFSEHVDSEEFLPVDEMERVSCSDSCSGLFSQLKEVYLFGCNTLNPEALHGTSEAIARMLVQSGHSPADAERLARALSVRYADSSRDRMRHIFKDVPAIYGFSSAAPLGPAAATLLDRYLQSGGARDIASGRAESANSQLLRRTLADDDARVDRRGFRCRIPPRRLPVLRRPPVDRAKGGLRSSAAESGHGRSAHVPRPYRELHRLLERHRSPNPGGCPGARRDCERPAGTRPVPGFRAQLRGARRPRSNDRAGGPPRVAYRFGETRRTDSAAQ